MVPLSFPIRVCFLWTNGILGFSARGTNVHLYWFMRNWWQSWPSVWVYTYVPYFHIHVVSTPMQHACAVSSAYLLCLLPLPLSSFPLSFLPLSHTYLSLSFPTLPFTHTSPLWCLLTLGLQTPSTQKVTLYRPVVLYDHLPKLSLIVGMLLWSSRNHSPPLSRAPHGYQ